MARIIERTIEFDAPPERVWQAITNPQEIAGWFGDTAELDLVPGGSGKFGWKDHGEFAVRVEIVEPLAKLAWRWSKESSVDIDHGISTLVEWVLTKRDDGGTILEVTETGFEDDKHVEENTGGWKAELGDLVEFIKNT